MDSYSLNFENIKKHGHVFENMTLTALRLSKTLNQLSKRCQIKKNIQLVAWGCQMEDDPCWDSMYNPHGPVFPASLYAAIIEQHHK